MRTPFPLIASAASPRRQLSSHSILNSGASDVLSMQVEKAANHCWNSTLLPVNIGILIRSSCLLGSFDMATDDMRCVFNSISDVTLATVGDEISLTLEANNERALLVT